MLVKFKVSNYKSISEEVTLDFCAAKYNELAQNLIQTKRYDLLKALAIYGANASGKSNILNAFVFMRWFAINSSKETQANENIAYNPFLLNKKYAKKDSTYEIVIILNGTQYRYGFSHNQKNVCKEWLFDKVEKKEVLLFRREGQKYKITSRFGEGKNLQDKTRKNVLFISVVSQFNGEIASKIIKWFQSVITIQGLSDLSYASHTIDMFNDPSNKSKIKSLLKFADVGIIDVEKRELNIKEQLGQNYEKLPEIFNKKFIKKSFGENIPTIKTYHNLYSESKDVIGKVEFSLDNESDGTKKYFNILGGFIEALSDGRLLIIDEIEARLHPILLKALVLLFNSKISNARGGQLLFSTHETHILSQEILRRDQIYFTEKNRVETTSLYSLTDFNPRNDLSIEKNYLGGRFGAIPEINNLEELFVPMKKNEDKCIEKVSL